jgi:hypothetical protein
MVVLFRNDSGAPSAQFSIPGYPDGSFEMTDWSSGKKIAVQSDKMRTNITIPFAAGETVAAFAIHRKSSSQ